MSGGDWILCERNGRWAAALRLAIARAETAANPQRLYETRNLTDVLTQLAARPQSVVLIEVHRTNLPDVLDCLAATTHCYPAARFAALFDGELAAHSASRHASPVDCRGEIREALAEAGASAFATSPRHLGEIFALAQMHAARLVPPTAPSIDQPLEAWAMSLLPWQDA